MFSDRAARKANTKRLSHPGEREKQIDLLAHAFAEAQMCDTGVFVVYHL